jgi:uncharacterized protein (TIGR03067 family)
MRPLPGVSLVLVVLCGCSGKPTDVAKTDAEKLEGTWAATLVETDGRKAPADLSARVQMKFQKGFLVIRGLFGDNREVPCQFQIDPDKIPRTIDWSDLGSKQTVLGIYELDGDRLKLCIITTKRDRPTEFKTGPKSNLSYLELKRAAR